MKGFVRDLDVRIFVKLIACELNCCLQVINFVDRNLSMK